MILSLIPPDHSVVEVQVTPDLLLIKIPGTSLKELFTLPGLLLLIATILGLIIPLSSRIGMGFVIFTALSMCFFIYLESVPTFMEFNYRQFRKGKIIRGRKFGLVSEFISDIEAIYRSQQYNKGNQSFSWVLKIKTVTRRPDVDLGRGLLNRQEIDWLVEIIHQWLNDFCGIQLDDCRYDLNRQTDRNDDW